MSDSQPLTSPKIARPRVAFDPLDPQWQNGARSTGASDGEPDAGVPGTSGAPRRAPRPTTPILSPEEQRAREQADALVIAARRAFVKGDLRAAHDGIKQAFAIESLNANGLELLGDIFLSEAEQEKAIAVFRRGVEKHPHHAAFEEKIALALLDIEEEKRDREMAQMLLDQPGLNRWAERKPSLAASLSFLMPGAGQFYNDQAERGAILFGAAVVTFGGWYWLWSAATSNIAGRQILSGFGPALANMSALGKLGFWVLFVGWLATVAFAARDAYQGAVEANRAHRPFEV